MDAREFFESFTRAARDRGKRLVVDSHLEPCLAPDQLVDAREQRPAADEHDPSTGDVGGQLGRRPLEQVLQRFLRQLFVDT